MRPLLVFRLVIVLVLAWLFRPFFHDLVMIFVRSPLTLILLGLIIYLIIRLVRVFRGLARFIPIGSSNYKLEVQSGFWRGFSLPILGVIVCLVGLFVQSEARLTLTARQMDFATRSTIPQFEPIRLTPKDVATRYAVDSFQNPQEHLGDSQIVLVDGKLERVFPRLPDGGLLYFFRKLTGFVSVEVDTLERKVAISDQQFTYAEGIGVFDNIYYRLPLKHYLVDYVDEPIYVKDDQGKWVTVVPYISYKNFPFTVPVWGGVMVVESDGKITDYTPEQAQQVSYLKGNRIHPKELASYYAHAYAYKGGLINKWFIHQNQTEVVSLPSDEEVIHGTTTEGFKQFIVAKPTGRSYGIYKIFLIDATTGKREIIEYDQTSQLTGPVTAVDYIKKEFPTYDWSVFSLVEPRPIIIDHQLYWLLSVIPNDAAGITTSVFLNTATNKVLKADNFDQIKAVIAGQAITAPPTSSPTTSSSDQIKQKIDAIEQQLQELKQLIK